MLSIGHILSQRTSNQPSPVQLPSWLASQLCHCAICQIQFAPTVTSTLPGHSSLGQHHRVFWSRRYLRGCDHLHASFAYRPKSPMLPTYLSYRINHRPGDNVFLRQILLSSPPVRDCRAVFYFLRSRAISTISSRMLLPPRA